ncbi:MAG: L-glutamate gamma-semialdehyde dehydrogenase, partial [Verrucomicrobia bacterium]|nr:L-glutamate gamma-semialdehyde dehydrogenase [Verrucomicrobiota bacterium]
ADHYQARYFDLIDALADEAETWPRLEQIDSDDRGDIPKVNVSIKISGLYSQIRPTDPEGALLHLGRRLRPLLRRAKERGVFVNFDMESTALKDLTLELFKRLLAEPEFHDCAQAGIALQAYLRQTESDLDELIDWARRRNRAITLRLIKGAYWDSETVLAQQRGWPVPVFQTKAETDANYERLAGRMLQNASHIRSAFGTHSVRTMASCIAQADRLGLSRHGFEFQTLYGMAEPIKLALIRMGCRVRDYCPIGETLPGMSYLVRRLLENASNEGFLRATFSKHVPPEALLRDPAGPASQNKPSTKERQAALPNSPAVLSGPRSATDGSGRIEPSFQNEPHTDFTIAACRHDIVDAISRVRSEFGRQYPLVIGGKEIQTREVTLSINPARPTEIIGRVSKAGRAEADAALASARKAFASWSRTGVEERAQLLERTASLIREERFRLAALEIFETGKNWTESDADVAEAIDFCRFYAEEMRRIGTERRDVSGETNTLHYIPRGVAVVIAPWNFPLAILCGMATAALVAGNAVILKPAEQSSVVAAWFMEILRRAGVPAGVVTFLPGCGEDIGEYLVNHPEVDLIAFTGSREVGLRIWEAAGRTQAGQRQLKKVICEMGGKNAMILDLDADWDEAVPGILASAFGYQGQKCSALARLIVLKESYDRVLDRLIEAVRSLRVGLPENPGTFIGPLIDQAACDRVRQYIEVGKQEATLAFQGEMPDGEGYFVPPVLFTDVPPKARIAQEEIFGPVLCVLKACDLDEALAWANDCPYALTGGLYSRNPASIRRVKAEMQVGNLYINRPITGAFVGRHPFGGFKMSGGGTKAGGRDYLKHFLFPRVVTENHLRRGFVPADIGAEDV